MAGARILITVCLAGYVVAAVGSGLDRVSQRAPALEGAVFAPFRAQADRAAASTALLRNQNTTALEQARAAVSSDPVDADSAALLGSALLAAGQLEAAGKAFRVAAAFGWRNVETQAYWYQAALQAGDLRVAADRADALLRTHPSIVNEEQLLEPIESQAAGPPILAEHLKMQPPWMRQYLTLPANSSSELLDKRFQVVSILGAGKVSLGCDAAAPFAKSLIQSDRWNDAKTFWNANCPSHSVSGLVGDPTFSSVEASDGPQLPFSWQVWRSGDILINQERNAGGALSVTNSASAPRLILSQPVAFPAGTYRFHVGPAQARSKGALTAVIGCEGKMPFPYGVQGDLLSAGQTLQVDKCPRQVLGLWLSGNGATANLRTIEVEKAA